LNAFQNGESLSEAQISARYDIPNVTAMITYLRGQGYPIYTNTRNGRTTYRLGNATRAMVATAYSIMGAREAGLQGAEAVAA
jgi:hypothetical protein